MIIGLTGYAGSGKDTVARSLRLRYGFARVAFADRLKLLANRLNPILIVNDIDFEAKYLNMIIHDAGGWDEAKRIPAVREYLQTLGNECRELLDKDVWVRAAKDTMISRLEKGAKHIVFTDVRYPNEVDYIHSWNGKVVNVFRPGVGPINDHISETELEYDYRITNDGTINDLGRKCTEMMQVFGAANA